MKTVVWFTLLLMFMAYSSYSQEVNKTVMDEASGKEILLGHCDRTGLMEGEFGKSFASEYDRYDPRKKWIRKIRKEEKDYVIVVVLGTWCHDSQMQVPRFYRVLDEANISPTIMNVICVDGYKESKDVPIGNYNIVFVPTFIFYRNGEEIGRIVESPQKSLEEDFYQIILQD